MYIALGLVYIFGSDTLDQQVGDFSAEMDPIIDECFNDPDFIFIVPYL